MLVIDVLAVLALVAEAGDFVAVVDIVAECAAAAGAPVVAKAANADAVQDAGLAEGELLVVGHRGFSLHSGGCRLHRA